MTAVFFIEVIWLIVYLSLLNTLSFWFYIAVAFIIFVVGLIIWDRQGVKEAAEEMEICRKYGCNATKEKIQEIQRDPKRRNQKRGRGPGNGNLTPDSCEICGAGVKDDGSAFFWNTTHLCYACEQRFQEAVEQNQIPYIPGYSDDETYGVSNNKALWIKQQITALDLMDGVINEQTAKAEIQASLNQARQWAEEQKRSNLMWERRQREIRRDNEEKRRLNDEVQRLLN